MEGYKTVDNLMIPVLAAIKRHVKEGDAITDIYNRAYEALMKAIDGKGAEMLDRDIEDTRQPDEGEDAELLWECVYNELPKELVEFVEDEIARLEDRIVGYAERLENLTDAIDNFLNDTREKESIEELEQSMKDYGKQAGEVAG